MSIDVEDQLSRLLDELADELDVPERWGSLEDLADADLRQVGPRPKVALAVAVAAALLLLSGTALIVRDRRGGAPVGTLRTASDATSAPTVPSKPTGTWDPSGPRLTDAELAQVITPVAGSDGTTVWRLIEPNGRPSQRGTVTGLSIVRTTLAHVSNTSIYAGIDGMRSFLPGCNLAPLPRRLTSIHEALTADCRCGSSRSTSRDTCPSRPAHSGPWTACPDVPELGVAFIGADGRSLTAHRSRWTSLLSRSQVKLNLAVLGPVGHWTPTPP